MSQETTTNIEISQTATPPGLIQGLWCLPHPSAAADPFRPTASLASKIGIEAIFVSEISPHKFWNRISYVTKIVMVINGDLPS